MNRNAIRYARKLDIIDALQAMGYGYFTAHEEASNYVRWGLRNAPSWACLSPTMRKTIRGIIKQLKQEAHEQTE